LLLKVVEKSGLAEGEALEVAMTVIGKYSHN